MNVNKIPQYLYVSKTISLACARNIIVTIASFVSPLLQTSENKHDVINAINIFLAKIEHILDPNHPYSLENMNIRAEMLASFVQLYLKFVSHTDCRSESQSVIGFKRRWTEYLCVKNPVTKQRRFVHIYKVLGDIAIIMSGDCSIYFFLADPSNKGFDPIFFGSTEAISFLHNANLQFSKSRVKACIEGVKNIDINRLTTINQYLGLALRLRQLFDEELCVGYLTTDTEEQHHVFESYLKSLIQAISNRLTHAQF